MAVSIHKATLSADFVFFLIYFILLKKVCLFLAASVSLCGLFSGCGARGLLSSGARRASRCHGCSGCAARAPGHAGSSSIRDSTHVPELAGEFSPTEPPGKPCLRSCLGNVTLRSACAISSPPGEGRSSPSWTLWRLRLPSCCLSLPWNDSH